MIPSELARQIAGTSIADDTTPKPPLVLWIQAECRAGCFKEALEEAAKGQVEPLRVDLALVEKVEMDKVTIMLPGRHADHESPSMFDLEARFELDPLSLAVRRV